MISYYHRTIRGKKLEQLESFKAGVWINVESPTDEELELLAEKRGLDIGLLTDAVDEDEMPRMETEGGTTYLFTRYPYTDDNLQIETAPLLFVVNKQMFLTISPHKITRLEKFTNGALDFSTTQQTKLLLQVLDQIDDEYENKLSGISRQIKSIRSRLRVEEINNKDFFSFVVIEDVLNEFLSALQPTNAILKRLLTGKHVRLYEEDKDLVDDLILNTVQSIESCKSTLKTIVNIREAYSTIMSNNLNRVIRLLTVLTVILSIPTLIASLYGMNVPLPFERSDQAFTIIMLLSVATSLLLIWIFKRRKWL